MSEKAGKDSQYSFAPLHLPRGGEGGGGGGGGGVTLGVDQDVVHKDHNKLIQIGLEYPMHEIHECCRGIRQPERHHCKLEMPIPHPKHCLRDICLPNSQLMKTNAKIYLGVDSRPFQLVKQAINPR